MSWDQANKKGNCGMDEEEVKMVAEKELKGNRQKGKERVLGGTSPLSGNT